MRAIPAARRAAASLRTGSLRPRVGLAYNVGGKGKTTIRGGFGIFYQPPFVEAYNNMVDSAPWSPQVQIFGVPFDNPYAAYPNPFPAQYAPFMPPSECAVHQAAGPRRLLYTGLETRPHYELEPHRRAPVAQRICWSAPDTSVPRARTWATTAMSTRPLPGPGATADNRDPAPPQSEFPEVVAGHLRRQFHLQLAAGFGGETILARLHGERELYVSPRPSTRSLISPTCAA